MEYNVFDKFKSFSLRHRGLTVFLLTSIIITVFILTVGVSFSGKFLKQEKEGKKT